MRIDRVAVQCVLLALGIGVSGCGVQPETVTAGISVSQPTGAVYSMTNAAEGNAVAVFTRLPDGSLTSAGTVDTGGSGTGAGLGNQGGLVLSNNGQWLLVVNAGSDDVSVFRVSRDGLLLTDVEPSGGVMPISVTIHQDLVYVVNAGDGGNIAGFMLSPTGDLSAIDGSDQALSGAADPMPAQIEFDPRGNVLVVTEKATNLIDTFVVDADGVAGPVMTHASSGATPFGFGFMQQGLLIVSEAFGGAVDASAVSSYTLDADGSISVVTASAPTTETAACWIASSQNNRFTYTTNTGSNSISGYSIEPGTGALTLLDADGVTAATGAGPLDMALSRDGRFLYVHNSGDGSIGAYRVDQGTGALTELSTVGGLPAGASGLAAR